MNSCSCCISVRYGKCAWKDLNNSRHELLLPIWFIDNHLVLFVFLIHCKIFCHSLLFINSHMMLHLSWHDSKGLHLITSDYCFSLSASLSNYIIYSTLSYFTASFYPVFILILVDRISVALDNLSKYWSFLFSRLLFILFDIISVEMYSQFAIEDFDYWLIA